LLDDPAGTNAKLKLFWLGVGRQDGLFTPNQAVATVLDSHGIHNTFFSMDGVHNYIVWRKCLEETLPLLFRADTGKPGAAPAAKTAP